MTKNTNMFVLVAAVAILVVATWFAFRPPSVPLPMPTETLQASSSNTTPEISTSGAKPAGTGKTAGVVFVTAPTAGSKWVIGTQNAITWNRATGSPNGNIILINAATGAIVGWIQQNLIATQSMFQWNTQDVFVSATSPSKKPVTPGTYIVKVSFNSPQYPPIASGAFSIIQPSQVATPTETITVRNNAATPSALTVKKGTQLIFINDDAMDYQITVTSYGSFDLKPNATYTFNTAVLGVGPYAFYNTAYSGLRTTVTVK